MVCLTRITALALLLLVAGCVTFTTPAMLRAKGAAIHGRSDLAYQDAYRHVEKQMRSCFERGFWSTMPPLDISGDIYTDTGRAEVRGEYGGGVQGYKVIVDISEAGDHSQVDIWTSDTSQWKRVGKSALAWSRGDDTGCGV